LSAQIDRAGINAPGEPALPVRPVFLRSFRFSGLSRWSRFDHHARPQSVANVIISPSRRQGVDARSWGNRWSAASV